MSNAKFKADFAKVLAAAKENANDVIRLSMLSLGRDVDFRAPVLTGRFRSNVNASVGVVDQKTDYPIDKTGSAARARLQVAVDSWRPGQTIYITSSLPYARVLEYGRANGKPGSMQAANGIFRLAVQNFSATVQRSADKLK